MPQYNVGHLERVSHIDDEAARLVEQALVIDSGGEERQALRLRMQRTRDTVGKLKRFETVIAQRPR